MKGDDILASDDFYAQLMMEEQYRRDNNGNKNDNNTYGILGIIGSILVLIVILVVVGSTIENDAENNTENNIENNTLSNNIVITEIEEKTSIKQINDNTVDYEEKEFENELNSSNLEMIGKTVKFSVKQYEPKSFFGDNCWSGEHLNFISDEKADAQKGDIIVGKVTEKPYKFLGCWIIHYEILSSEKNNVKDANNENVLVENNKVNE